MKRDNPCKENWLQQPNTTPARCVSAKAGLSKAAALGSPSPGAPWQGLGTTSTHDAFHFRKRSFSWKPPGAVQRVAPGLGRAGSHGWRGWVLSQPLSQVGRQAVARGAGASQA